MDATDYLDQNIRASIEGDIDPLVDSGIVSEIGGFFGSAALIFAIIDALGYLFKGKSSMANAYAFIKGIPWQSKQHL